MSVRDTAQRALITKCVADVADASIAARRQELDQELAEGEKHTVKVPGSPDLKLGQVWKSDPSGSAVVTDRAKFTVWHLDTYPERVKAVETITDLKAAVEVLREHAPDLLSTESVVEPWAEKEILLLTAKHKQPRGPGGELDVPGVAYEPPKAGVVTVKLSEDAPAAIGQLWREGRIDLITGEVLALEAP